CSAHAIARERRGCAARVVEVGRQHGEIGMVAGPVSPYATRVALIEQEAESALDQRVRTRDEAESVRDERSRKHRRVGGELAGHVAPLAGEYREFAARELSPGEECDSGLDRAIDSRFNCHIITLLRRIWCRTVAHSWGLK